VASTSKKKYQSNFTFWKSTWNEVVPDRGDPVTAGSPDAAEMATRDGSTVLVVLTVLRGVQRKLKMEISYIP
jgi:hypothetical protein